jgi:hypothetical protein
MGELVCLQYVGIILKNFLTASNANVSPLDRHKLVSGTSSWVVRITEEGLWSNQWWDKSSNTVESLCGINTEWSPPGRSECGNVRVCGYNWVACQYEGVLHQCKFNLIILTILECTETARNDEQTSNESTILQWNGGGIKANSTDDEQAQSLWT